jgi:hypothetical protein
MSKLPGIEDDDIIPSHPHLIKEDGGLFWPSFKLCLILIGIMAFSLLAWHFFIRLNCPCK